MEADDWFYCEGTNWAKEEGLAKGEGKRNG